MNLFSKLIPDGSFERVDEITPNMLRKAGICAVVCDLDNTLTPYHTLEATDYADRWLRMLIDDGFSVMVLSNNRRKYHIDEFCGKYGIGGVHFAKKPFKSGFLRAIAALNVSPDKILFVGDQIFTDIFGSKRCNMKAAIVRSISENERFHYRIRRLFELPFINAGKNGQLLR